MVFAEADMLGHGCRVGAIDGLRLAPSSPG